MMAILFPREEQIVSRVWHTHFLPNMRSVASRSRRFPTFCVHALNRRRAREHPAPFTANNVDKQPRNRIPVRRTHIRNRFTRHAAPVASLPRRPAEMLAEGIVIQVEQPRIRRLQRPSALPALTLADVHLIALRVHLKNKLLSRGRLNLLRDSP